MIYYGHQHITEKDIQAVEKVLHSDWLTQGPAIEAFEKKMASYCGAKYEENLKRFRKELKKKGGYIDGIITLRAMIVYQEKVEDK